MLHEMTAAQWDLVLTVNLRGAFLGTRAAARIMIPQNWGRIINISSRAGKGSSYGHCSYSSSKAGMIGLTKSTARELGQHNITANAILPGFIATELTAKLDANITNPEQVVLHPARASPKMWPMPCRLFGLGRGGVDHRNHPGGDRRHRHVRRLRK